MFGEKSVLNIMHQTFSKLIKYPVSFFDKNNTGELFSRINTDITSLKSIYSEQLASIIYNPFIILFCALNVFRINWKLAIIVLIILPTCIFLMTKFGKKIKQQSKSILDQYSIANIILSENLKLIRVVKIFNRELFESKRYSNALECILIKIKNAVILRSALYGVSSLLLITSLTIIIYFSSQLLHQGIISTGQLTELLINVIYINNAFANISIAYTNFQKSSGATENIHNMLNEKIEKIIPDSPVVHFQHKLIININSFSYPVNIHQPILESVNLKIKKGEKIGIIGVSGGGKSTIIKLLLQLYNSYDGEILLDGLDIRKLDLSSYRQLFGVVSQEVDLFSASIYDNIRYGNLTASEGEIIDAAIIAGAFDFINSFPKKFDTLVGENGVMLSGGQRQRIALARAIIKDPEILILDEATSALDIDTEHFISSSLEKKMINKTIIILTHKPSLIKSVDRLYKIQDKLVTEISRDQYVASFM